ncbi:hypothetical protein QCA50_009039 [Cerrena zonata]|uniref:Thaumatin-like protein n=1 Tax=Cerrena zonata TaxID=2478898 RepID=A0AAW0GFL5_9APHY
MAIAQCGDMGEGCLTVETTLRNPVTPGIGSGTDLNLIFPHAFSANTSFEYFNGCDGVGQSCDNPACPDAFHSPDDERTVTVCLADNVNLAITFCQ